MIIIIYHQKVNLHGKKDIQSQIRVVYHFGHKYQQWDGYLIQLKKYGHSVKRNMVHNKKMNVAINLMVCCTPTPYAIFPNLVCIKISGTTWCAQDAGNGVWLNGSNVVGNDPSDTSIPCTVQGAKEYVQAVRAAYPDSSPIFSVDNEPTLWSGMLSKMLHLLCTLSLITNQIIRYSPRCTSNWKHL